MSTSEKSAAPRRVRTGTVVWGALILVIAALILVSLLAGIRFDLGIVFLTLLIGAGLALVLGGISSMTRRQSGADPGPDGTRYDDTRLDDTRYDGGRYDPDRDDTGSTGS
jgi:predicted phage tail protein